MNDNNLPEDNNTPEEQLLEALREELLNWNS